MGKGKFFKLIIKKNLTIDFITKNPINAIIACVTLSAPIPIKMFYDMIGENMFLNALFLSFVRLFWGIAISWVIYNCHRGRGGFLNRFLSLNVWVPIGKLGFSVYLVSSVIQYNFNSSKYRRLNLEIDFMVRQES